MSFHDHQHPSAGKTSLNFCLIVTDFSLELVREIVLMSSHGVEMDTPSPLNIATLEAE